MVHSASALLITSPIRSKSISAGNCIPLSCRKIVRQISMTGSGGAGESVALPGFNFQRFLSGESQAGASGPAALLGVRYTWYTNGQARKALLTGPPCLLKLMRLWNRNRGNQMVPHFFIEGEWLRRFRFDSRREPSGLIPAIAQRLRKS
jgi:hypothetical protein